VEIRYAELRL